MMPYVHYRSGVRLGPPHLPELSEGSDDDDDSEVASDSLASAPDNDRLRLYHAAYSDAVNSFLYGSDAGSAVSVSPPPSPPSRLNSPLHHDLGLADSGSSEAPEYLGEDSDDESHETESDGELSNVISLAAEDDEFDEVPHPPQLPSVAEERLQEVWPLGDASFSIFLCPITHDVMTDPVVSADGYTYERSAIARWFSSSRNSPVTGQPLPHSELVPNHSVRTLLKTLIDMTSPQEIPASGPAVEKAPQDVRASGSKEMLAPEPGSAGMLRTATLASTTTASGEGTDLGPGHSAGDRGDGGGASTPGRTPTMSGSAPSSGYDAGDGVSAPGSTPRGYGLASGGNARADGRLISQPAPLPTPPSSHPSSLEAPLGDSSLLSGIQPGGVAGGGAYDASSSAVVRRRCALGLRAHSTHTSL